MKKQDFKVLKTKDLYPFPDNPFHVAEDETLSELAESIKEFPCPVWKGRFKYGRG